MEVEEVEVDKWEGMKEQVRRQNGRMKKTRNREVETVKRTMEEKWK